jgi:formamidopyrimidine-DNA glycosylase
MPELAEVFYYLHRWDPALGQTILHVACRPCRVTRGLPRDLAGRLTGTRLERSEASGKQMLFRFSGGHWLGIHLGMTGELRVDSTAPAGDAHAHLVLQCRTLALSFRDPRRFGRLLYHEGREAPGWWTNRPPDLLGAAFTRRALEDFLQRRKGSPIKAVLLLQERFPGIGNWMADEILWRAAIAPRRRAGSLDREETAVLWKEIRAVCRDALRVIGRNWGDPPDSWLFHHRWKAGGRCPRTGQPLRRETIGGRTTCWSPARQR